MRLWFSAVFVCVIMACNNNSSAKKDSEQRDSSSSKSIPGADVDEHGCKASAGYQWSKLKDKCIRVFEEGIKLLPQDAVADKTSAAFIIFATGNNQAEAFIPSESSSVILNRKGETTSSWIGQPDWKLEAKGTGYVLKNNGVVQYVK